MRRFKAETLPGPGEVLLLDAEVSHHLLRVTGIAPGEAVLLFDGLGLEAEAVFLDSQGGLARLRQVGQARALPDADVCLLVGICKHAAMDTIVRMATELGASRIQPVLAARSVARGDRRDRWLRIAESSAAQCGRASLPELSPALALEPALATVPGGWERRVLVPGGPESGLLSPPSALLVGPEGGLSPDEVELARAHGFRSLGLGPRVLRADTAVAAALARVS